MEGSLLNLVLSSAKQHIKNLLKFQNVYVVIGNETCDLDSAVCSLVYSVFLHHTASKPSSIVIPVLNIPRVQLPIKTEITYILSKWGIDSNQIICRDEIDLESLQQKVCLKVTLVDHHVLPNNQLKPAVVAVIDHRPPDPDWQWPNVDFTLREVGSCTTLVAEILLSQTAEIVSPMIATWLLGTILLDTACLSPLAGRATAIDLKVVAQLESYCPQSLDKEQLYKELQTAKSDIVSLSAYQLLIKDFKVVSGIPIAGLYIKVKNFLARKDAVDGINQFCRENNTDVCLIYGQEMSPKNLTRDMAVYGSGSMPQKVVSALVMCKDPCLNLQPLTCSVPGASLFEQLNVKPSRKQILPIIKKVALSINK